MHLGGTDMFVEKLCSIYCTGSAQKLQVIDRTHSQIIFVLLSLLIFKCKFIFSDFIRDVKKKNSEKKINFDLIRFKPKFSEC